LRDLAAPPGNQLEALKGDRAGQHSIRINDQWRLCFRWREGDAYDVEIVDYH
jgi:proteic killer suppression protein